MSAPDLSGMDAQARRFLAMVAVGADTTAAYASIEDRRRSFDQLMRFSRPPAAAIETRDLAVPGRGGPIPLRMYASPKSTQRQTGLIYLHGGGLVAGSIASHDAICRTLSLDADCIVISIGYRLAPEHPFPAAIIDALRATRWISHHQAQLGIEAIAVGGDSGGATLATIVCQIVRRSIRIEAQVLLCPVLDATARYDSRRLFASGFLLDATTMASDLELYAPTRALLDPRVSPLHEPSLAGMPHTIIHTAGFDPLRDEGAAYAARLREAGVVVDYVCHDALIHHFYGLTGAIPAAGRALAAICSDLKRLLA